VTGPAAFLVAGAIDVLCALPLLARYVWRQRKRAPGARAPG
jgi:hypothetical protein